MYTKFHLWVCIYFDRVESHKSACWLPEFVVAVYPFCLNNDIVYIIKFSIGSSWQWNWLYTAVAGIWQYSIDTHSHVWDTMLYLDWNQFLRHSVIGIRIVYKNPNCEKMRYSSFRLKSISSGNLFVSDECWSVASVQHNRSNTIPLLLSSIPHSRSAPYTHAHRMYLFI